MLIRFFFIAYYFSWVRNGASAEKMDFTTELEVWAVINRQLLLMGRWWCPTQQCSTCTAYWVQHHLSGQAIFFSVAFQMQTHRIRVDCDSLSFNKLNCVQRHSWRSFGVREHIRSLIDYGWLFNVSRDQLYFQTWIFPDEKIGIKMHFLLEKTVFSAFGHCVINHVDYESFFDSNLMQKPEDRW